MIVSLQLSVFVDLQVMQAYLDEEAPPCQYGTCVM